MQPIIRMREVTKRYGDQLALDRVTLDVPPGVVFAVLGENGAGKTTMIRTMLGLLDPDDGTTTVMGFDSSRDGLEIRRALGYVAERPALDEWMRVDDVGWFAAGFYPDGFQERYRGHIQRFGVPAAKKIKQLSKGMRSKVALSLALAGDPQLLILDEPTSGLDTLVRREFLQSMVEFTANGKTVFLSSHQIHEVERVADIVAIVRKGVVLDCRPLDELKASVTEASVSMTTPDPVELPPGIISFQRRSRQAQLYVCGDESATESLLSDLPYIEQFELRRPSLEEIFVAYMRSEVDSDALASPPSPLVSPKSEIQP